MHDKFFLLRVWNRRKVSNGAQPIYRKAAFKAYLLKFDSANESNTSSFFIGIRLKPREHFNFIQFWALRRWIIRIRCRSVLTGIIGFNAVILVSHIHSIVSSLFFYLTWFDHLIFITLNVCTTLPTHIICDHNFTIDKKKN